MKDAAMSTHSVVDDVNVLDYLAVLWRYRWLIAGVFATVIGAAFIFTVITPKMYESAATLLAPKEGAAAAGLLGGLAASGLAQTVPGLAQTVPGLANFSASPNRDLLVAVLKSRTMSQIVVEKFGLRERYRVRYMEDAIKELQTRISVSAVVTREGIISLRVEDTDPKIAADMANFFVDQLDRLVSRLGTGEASRQRVFITEQLARARTDLEGAEETLRRFQERNRAVVLQEQTRGVIAGAARLKGEIIAAEVQLQVTRNFATDANPDIIAIRRRIEEMKRQLAQMEYGDDGAPLAGPAGKSRDRREISVPMARVPEIGLELVRLTREVKVGETVVILLTQQLEQAKINEAKDLPVVQVLDRAVPAERHSWPKLRLNLAIATVVSLMLSVFLVLFVDYIRNLSRRARTA